MAKLAIPAFGERAEAAQDRNPVAPEPLETTDFGGLYAAAFRRPGLVFTRLARRSDRLAQGARALGVTAALYTLVYFFLAHNGGRPTVFQPWLAVPAESYYRFNFWVHAPSIVLAWVAAAGFVHLAARALGGMGSWEGVLAVLGFGISISTWWTGLHDLVTTALGYFGYLDQRAYEDALSAPTPWRTLLWILMAGYALSFFTLFAKGVAAAHELSPRRAALAGAVGVVAYHAVFLIFNR